MTAVDLLNALKAYTEDKVKDMRLIARVPENGTDPGERPPLVFIGNLPNKEQEKKAAPYILLKLLTKKVDDEENVCRVRIICVTFSEDKNENYMQCLNLVTKIETSLLEDVVIDEHYSCQKPIETIIYILVVTPKKLNPGKVATAAAAEVSGEYAVSYYATYIDGKKKLEIDPLNYIYYVNGKDYLADVRKALGK